MSKGSIAKENLIKKLIDVAGDDYVGEASNKYYFWSNEDGEKIQVCVSLTCPKTPLETSPALSGGGYDFSSPDTGAKVWPQKPVEYTDEEKANIDKLIRELKL